MTPSLLPGIAAAALLIGAVHLPGQTTAVVPCAKDNTLYESATGSLSNGSGPSLFVGVTGQPGFRRSLLKFDVAAAIPAGARVLSAQLTINTVQSVFGGVVNVMGHRVLQNWGEGPSVAMGGGGSGAAAAIGDATWLHTFNPVTLWTNPGGDFASTASFSIATQPSGVATAQPTAGAVADVQSWLDNPGTNHGWLLKTNEAVAFVTRKIDSREATAGIPPTLSVRYLLPSQTGTHGLGCLVGAQRYSYSTGGPVIGGTVVPMLQTNGPQNQLSANLLSLGWNPAGFPLVPQCLLYLPPGPLILTHSIVLLDGAGSALTPFLLPLGYHGVAINAQAAALDPTSPSGFVLSNAAILVLL